MEPIGHGAGSRRLTPATSSTRLKRSDASCFERIEVDNPIRPSFQFTIWSKELGEACQMDGEVTINPQMISYLLSDM